MKRIIIVIICILSVKFTYAQQDLLSFDEHNKYIYYQVVDMPGISADTLYTRGLYFIKTVYPKLKFKTTNGKSISGDGKFTTYNNISILKHESGEIAYLLNIEFKDQKYRYWLTDFTFTPYVKDRYGNFVPKLGNDIPLEIIQSKLDKKDSDNYLDETGTFCKQFGEGLKQFLVNAPKKEETTKKIVIDKW